MNATIEQAITGFEIKKFQQSLVDWYYHEKRDLPWRRTSDPFKIWVSEVMLQQTRVDTVIPYYERFLKKFPTLKDFADASEDEILKAWEGLGYYSRVRNLQTAVKEVQEKYNGSVPDNIEEFQTLKGVGPYTSGAVMSIAFNKPEPAVDGNVMRVFSRLFTIEEDIAKPKTRKVFEALVKEVIDSEDPSAFNQGIMELGAMVCTPQSPSCLLCPVRDHCKGFHEGKQSTLPIKNLKKSTKKQKWMAAIIYTDDHQIVINKRADTGLLASMWQYPIIERTDLAGFRSWLNAELNIKIEHLEPLTTVKHIFSHVEWEIDAYAVKGSIKDVKNPYKLITEEEIQEHAFPVPFQKIWNVYKGEPSQ